MDTICLRSNERVLPPVWILAGMLACCLMLFVSVRATEVIAYSVPQVPEITSSDTEKLLEEFALTEFDWKIRNKYPGGQITDLGKGVKRIKVVRYFNSRPVKLNIIETDFTLNKNLVLKPAIAGKTLSNKAKIKKFSERENALVSVNGGFFKPQTGVPLGLLMIDGRVYTGDIYNRVAMGIFDDGFKMAQTKVDIKLASNKRVLNVDNINQPRTLASHVLVYDSLWGEISPPAPKGGFVFSVSKGKLVNVSNGAIAIPKDGFVISGPSSKVLEIIKDKRFKLSVNTTPDWKKVKHIISGGPYLIRNGQIYIDVSAQKLHSITGRNPRTAIGYTKEGNIIIVTADGREKASVGLTLNELAWYMKQLGCVDAMNLDGGGSTVMYGAGQVLNSPVISGGIAVSNAVLLVEDDV